MLKVFLTSIMMLFLSFAPFVHAETILDDEQQFNVQLIEKWARYYHQDVNFCKAIGWVESKYYSMAYYNAKSEWNNEYWISRGVMQVQFDTAKKYYPRIRKPEDVYAEWGIIAGIKYIRYLFKTYPLMTKAQIAQIYNAGEEQFFDPEKPVRSQGYVRKLHKAYHRGNFKDDLDNDPSGRIKYYFPNSFNEMQSIEVERKEDPTEEYAPNPFFSLTI